MIQLRSCNSPPQESTNQPFNLSILPIQQFNVYWELNMIESYQPEPKSRDKARLGNSTIVLVVGVILHVYYQKRSVGRFDIKRTKLDRTFEYRIAVPVRYEHVRCTAEWK